MNQELEIYNDPDVIAAQFQGSIVNPLAISQAVAAGAVTNIAGASGSSITVTGSSSSGWTISATGVGNQLTFSIAVTNAATARSGLGIDAIATKKSNLTATVAPTVNDDSSAGYAVGSFWLGTVLAEAYVCLDVTVGAAVWSKITP